MAGAADTLQEQATAQVGWRRRLWPDPWWPAAVIALVAFGGLVLFVVPLGGVNLSRMNGLGLISVLPWMSLLGVTVAVIAFCTGLCLSRAYPAVLGVTLVGIVICLQAVTVFVEPEPRFPSAYQIAGFVEYVSRTGHTAPSLAAYFSWPGFFSAVAFLEGVTGHHNLFPVMRLWPVIIDLTYLIPLYLIMRNLRATWRAKWLAVFLFEVGNWVGQDYFSPQSFNFLLYLAFIAFVLTWFNWRPRTEAVMSQVTPEPARGIRSRWRSSFSRLVPGEIESGLVPPAQRAVLLAILLGIFVFSTISHQLTPINMIIACTALVAVRRCRITGLPVLLAVIVTGWVSFAAVAFWSGHMSDLFGGLGHLDGNLTISVANRIVGTAQHRLVTGGRSVGAAAFVSLGVAGLLRRWYRGVDDRVLAVLMCVPFLDFAAQSYGGEIALRVYLFALPAAAILASYLFFPPTREEEGSHRWRAFLLLTVCAVTLLFGFFVFRYGNEAFEQVPTGEVNALNYVYAHDQNGARVLWLSESPTIDNTPEMPWEYRDMEKVQFIAELAPRNPRDVTALVATLRSVGLNTYLIVTSTQVNYLIQGASYPANWGSEFRAQMAATPGVRTVLANPDAVIYTVQWPPGTRARPVTVGTTGPPASSTLWTAVGLIVLCLLLLVLTAREFIRVCLDAPRLTRLLTLVSLPMLAVFVGVVIMRFIVLS